MHIEYQLRIDNVDWYRLPLSYLENLQACKHRMRLVKAGFIDGDPKMERELNDQIDEIKFQNRMGPRFQKYREKVNYILSLISPYYHEPFGGDELENL